MIRFENVEKTYPDGFQALKELNLEFKEGKINVLIGPSGCGKTTTMKMINRLIEHTDGTITINEKNINHIDRIELRRSIGYVIQSIGLFPHMTIYDNVATVPKLLKWNKRKIDQRVEELLTLVDLDPKTYRKRYPSELSGGQQQRIGVIRALAAEPSIILMDEPFSALDPISREQLQDELVRLQQEIKKTIIFVTHDMDEALKIADQIFLMKDGQIEQMGTPNELLQNPASPFVEEFIGAERMGQAKQLPSIKQCMDVSPVTVLSAQTLSHAIDQMLLNQLDSIPVINHDDSYQGTLTLYQAIQHQEKTIQELTGNHELIGDVESKLDSLLKRLTEDNVRNIPIMDKNNKLVGVLKKEKLLFLLQEFYVSRIGAS